MISKKFKPPKLTILTDVDKMISTYRQRENIIISHPKMVYNFDNKF